MKQRTYSWNNHDINELSAELYMIQLERKSYPGNINELE